jgi:formylglycine-generating enzyme required for sulfatase activity
MTFSPARPSCIRRQSYKVHGHTFHTILVEKGTFTMGSDNSKYYDENPAHQVTITADFELSEYPVTQALWQAVMGVEWQETRFKGADRPVECVSWDDAQGFLVQLNKWYRDSGQAAGRLGVFCLPTEAQWEYAARGGLYGKSLSFEYAGGNRMKEVGWYSGNSHDETRPVGRKQPNVLGLYDMSGNVWEWCQDWKGSYSSGSVTDPVGPNSGSFRVYRGGSWDDYADGCRVAYRSDDLPGYRLDYLGFRLAFVPQSGG